MIVLAYAGHHAVKDWKVAVMLTEDQFGAMANEQLEQRIKENVPSAVTYHIVKITKEPVSTIQA